MGSEMLSARERVAFHGWLAKVYEPDASELAVVDGARARTYARGRMSSREP